MSDGGTAAVRVQLLGPVRAWRSSEELKLGGPRRRAVLGMLAMRAHRGVSRNELVDGLWGQELPPSAVNSLHVCIAGLRRVLEPGRARRAPARILVASGAGYQLRLEPGKLDSEVFSGYLMRARQLTEAGDYAAAVQVLETALALWAGDPLAGVPGPWADAERTRLEELRHIAIGERIDLMLVLGRHHEALAELARLIREYPLRERFRGQLMLAMHRCGRRADALAAFTGLRRLLAEELGIDPSPGLRLLHQQILTGDAALDLPPEPASLVLAQHDDPVGPTVPVPRELPPDVDAFVGRAAELAELDRMLGTSHGSMVISAVAGTAGIGKTTLAVHWGHRVRDAFPDGQLYADLRGYDLGEPVTATEALARFLRSLGASDRDIPADADERAARYRSVLDGRRILVILDNAASVEQVRPLLPGVPSCVVVVTSRDSLAGLVARNGARRLDLDFPSADEAALLLRELIGARADADPTATAALARRCARLPLALRVAAELAVARPSVSLAELVEELAYERRLDLLDAGGDDRTAVRRVFSWSYRHLPPDDARAFRLLGLHPGPDFDEYAAAALTSTAVDRAVAVLRGLAQAHLIQPAGPGRYSMHDLLRAFAGELATAISGSEVTDALTRLLDYYLAAADAARNILVPAERAHSPGLPPITARLPAVTDPAAARNWLDGERAVLVTMAGYAAIHGWPSHATRLSSVLWRYLATGHYLDAVAVHGHARDAARRSGDRRAEAYALNYLGIAEERLARYSEAAGHLEQARDLFRKAGDRLGEGLTLINLTSGDWRQGRYQAGAIRGWQALDLFRGLGDKLGQAHAMNSIGLINWRQGRYRDAVGHFRQAMLLYQAVGDTSNEAHALGNLGMVSGILGRFPEATSYLQGALALFRKLGYRSGEATTLTDLGSAASQQGRYAEAMGHQRQALAVFREIGEPAGEAEALNGLGEALLANGEPDRAYAHHAAALDLATQIGDKHERARARNGIGAALAHVRSPAALASQGTARA